MGVMSCSRKRCENIMCDTYIYDIGYVCNECQGEFKYYLQHKNKTNIPEGEIRRELKEFMDTYKDDYKNDGEISIDDFFDEHTK